MLTKEDILIIENMVELYNNAEWNINKKVLSDVIKLAEVEGTIKVLDDIREEDLINSKNINEE